MESLRTFEAAIALAPAKCLRNTQRKTNHGRPESGKKQQAQRRQVNTRPPAQQPKRQDNAEWPPTRDYQQQADDGPFVLEKGFHDAVETRSISFRQHPVSQ